MKNSNFNFYLFFSINFNSFSVNAVPDSFADLVEELIPSVVSIASTTIIKKSK